MKKTLLAVAIASACLPNFAFAEEGDWVVRLRAVNVSPNESSKLGQTVAKNVAPGLINPSANLKVDDNVIPELDISYYITKNIAAELILALGTKHDVKVSGSGAPNAIQSQNLGEVNLLPPTLTLQWHFRPDQTFDPYIGAGVNYTAFLDRNLKFSQGIPGTKIKVDSDSWGLVAQAGFDINLKDGWMINADVKYVTIDTDVKAKIGGNWTKIDSLDIDPWVIGIGIGKRF
jgi:outer membrane protein